MLIAAALLAGVLADRLLGEPRRFHPLVGFGNLASALEARLNTHPGQRGLALLKGAVALVLLVVPLGLASALLWWWLVAQVPLLALAFGAVVLYASLGWRSLEEHVRDVDSALAQSLPAGRAAVQHIVSRDCAAMDESQVVRASLETLLENTSDAIVGPLFWFTLLGPAGALVYRLSNTLDAMWGYRSARFNYFGRAAARWDDLLNLVPARLTALAFALVGDTASALGSWRRFARHWASPNAGPVICAGSGALNISLGGGACYQGQWETKPATCGRPATRADIGRALALVRRAVLLLLVSFIVVSGIFALADTLLNGVSL
ncbi:adenosylcobinamide-phosphate synthase CbiB [Cellvibrio japonicus]|uniref:Cobalamin biosynthesis protein CobD n=1 Tax=Cellvibrio japonicus (strain Ueda107) TaxID=498211 RepID=B3PIN7_CELJU|nr:adenosylcobinamide-phosphate synthase CbiB [Cellvibrio japonicus]ACE85651.1 cobalamin biosynthesis protein CobD [Cellvibrio japonicus Ueda107]QEI13955.1 cobalamin biosynthesis protein CobD [Cellvibrio japonicus]QEI17529.1 cobalamin biosynthesis protein CobD [Cellvibrio japonicus]QEI21105.1 cobalamin biosynthesis protein CobD [Cellvibrio japonicus]